MKLLIAIILISLVSGVAVAEQRPDFSGQWILASSPSATAATEMTVEFWVSDSSRPREFVSVERWFDDHSMETFSMVIVSPLVPAPVGGSRSGHYAAFEGQTLVIQRETHSLPTREWTTERKEIWSLTPNGLLRIIATDRPANGEHVTTEAIYRRL
jgi:hypothetical protein